jgi:hypothetical protein
MMPKVNDEALEQSFAAFVAGFKYSPKGNRWRHHRGLTVSVYARQDGYWGYSIASEDGVRFSRGGWPEQTDALTALWEEVRPP